MANFQITNNTAGRISVCGETIEGNATNTVGVDALYKVPNASKGLADMVNNGTLTIILPAYRAERVSLEETQAYEWLYNTFARKDVSVTTGELHVYADGTDGDDSNDGLTVSTPKKTLHAVSALVPHFIAHPTIVHLSGKFDDVYKWHVYHTLLGQATNPDIYKNDYPYLLIDGGDELTTIAGPYTADIASTTSIGLTTAGWTIDEHAGYWVEIMDGALAGTVTTIQKHTADTITPSKDFDSAPTGAQFRIVRPATEIASSVANAQGIMLNVRSHEYLPFLQRLYLSGSKAGISCKNSNVMQLCGIISDATGASIQQNEGGYFLSGNYAQSPVGGELATISGWQGAGVSHRAGGVSLQGCTAKLWNTYAKRLLIRECPVFQTQWACRFRSADIYGTLSTFGNTIKNTSGWATPMFGNGDLDTGLYLQDSAVHINGVIDASDNTTHGIELHNSRLKLDAAITGSGNGSSGVYAHSGSVVQTKSGSAPTITGNSGTVELTFDGTTEASTWADIDAGTAVSSAAENSMAKKI